MHSGREISARRRDQQVVVRRKRAPGMDVPVMVIDRPTDEEEEHSVIDRVEKERLAAVRLGGDVIDRAGLLDPSGTAHWATVSVLVWRTAARGKIVAVLTRGTRPVPGTRQVRFRHLRASRHSAAFGSYTLQR